MNKAFGWGAAGVCVIAVGAVTAGAVYGVRGHGVQSMSGDTAVVVELFTSEGCSSCPPADTVLQNLVQTQPVRGVHVIGLGEHVDYWNQLGWRDPFSSELLTQRQSAYATTFHNDQVYTPQMVVQGQSEFVGSDLARAKAEISRAATRRQASVTIRAAQGAHAGLLSVHIDVERTPAGEGAPHVFAAVIQDRLSSPVTAGENRGRYLTHAAVVRTLRDVGTIPVSGGKFSFDADLKVDAALPISALQVIAFVQSPVNGRISGAAQVSLAGISR